MTSKELKQYRSIIAEIDEIRDRINNSTVSDTVRGSDAEYPYVTHSMNVSGITEISMSKRYIARLRRLEKQKKAIENFIDSIPDSMTRRLFLYRYIEGERRPSWTDIAMRVTDGVYSGDNARMIVNRYIKKNIENH